MTAGSPVRRAFGTVMFVIVVVAVSLLLIFGGLVLTAPRAQETQGWLVAAPMPTRRGEVAAAVTADDRLTVVGGLKGLGQVTAEVKIFNPDKSEWRSGPDLPSPRHHAAAASLGDRVYVSGGAADVRSWTGTDEVWRLNEDRDGWEAAPPMPEVRWGHRMVELDGRLYVIGGHGDTAAVLIYDPETGWSRGAEMPRPRDHLGAVVRDGEIWAVGGRDHAVAARVDIYNPRADSWRDGPPLPVPTSGAAVGVVGDRIVVVGGEDPSLLEGRVVQRHWQRGREGGWEPLPSPPLAVHGAGAAVLRDNFLLVGGAGRQGWLSVTSWTGAMQVLTSDQGGSAGLSGCRVGSRACMRVNGPRRRPPPSI